jgi:drug/metabolite transporter (DMT)-like permease
MESSRAAFFALGSAALFGISTPLAKLLLGQGANPWLLAGLLYLGSGIGLTALRLGRQRRNAEEAPLRRGDWPWLGVVIASGGVAGPLLLMLGLRLSSASSASLLLNLEALATMAIAWVVFRENAGPRILLGAVSILAGAILLSWERGAFGVSWGAVFIAGACLCWGIDNNLTRKLSASDPMQIASIKGLAAGVVNTGLAFLLGAHVPSLPTAGAAALIGFAGYGVSLVLFVLALRHLGSARTGAYFATAPFIGALASTLLFHDALTVQFTLAAAFMAFGVWLHLTESHAHEHPHEALAHEHRHVHDQHHDHTHGPDDPPGEPHTHWHGHAVLTHSHPHYPDLHHRHDHR